MLLVLVIGGTGYLYGGLIGAVVFVVMQDVLSAATPQYWQFWLGLILIVIVLVGRERIVRPWHARLGRSRRRRRGASAESDDVRFCTRRTRGLYKRFGGIVATQDVTLTLPQGARHALIGPNGAGKTTLVNLITGMLAPSAGTIELDGRTSRDLPAHRRAQRGSLRTFQINQLFAQFTPLETIALVVARARGHGARACARAGPHDERGRRGGRCCLREFHLDRRHASQGRRAAVRPAAPARDRDRGGRASRACCCWTSPVAGVPAGESAEILDTLAALPADVARAADRARHGPRVPLRAAHLRSWSTARCWSKGAADEIARDPRVKAAYLGEASLA